MWTVEQCATAIVNTKTHFVLILVLCYAVLITADAHCVVVLPQYINIVIYVMTCSYIVI